MSTPVGHLLSGALVGLLLAPDHHIRRAAVVGGLIAMSPDLDFVPGLLIGDPRRFHHAATHSIPAALIAGAVAAVASRAWRGRWAIIATLAYATHLLLDYLTVDDSVPRGIPLLWPLSRTTFASPSPPFERVIHSDGGPLFGSHNFAVAGRELAILLPLLVLAVLWTRVRVRKGR